MLQPAIDDNASPPLASFEDRTNRLGVPPVLLPRCFAKVAESVIERIAIDVVYSFSWPFPVSQEPCDAVFSDLEVFSLSSD